MFIVQLLNSLDGDDKCQISIGKWKIPQKITSILVYRILDARSAHACGRNWMSWVSASGAAKASNWVPSSVRAAVSFLDSRLNGLMVRVAVRRWRMIFQVP